MTARPRHMAKDAPATLVAHAPGRRVLCALLAASLVLSSVPTASLRAIADELGAAETTEEEVVQAEPTPEPEPEVTPEPEPEPEPATDPEPAQEPATDPAPEPAPAPEEPSSDPEPAATEEPASEPAANEPDLVGPAVQEEPVVETTNARAIRRLGAVPATDSVTLSAIGSTSETPLEDGSYLPFDVIVTATGTGISETDYPTVTLTYKDAGSRTRTTSYQLDASSWELVSGVGYATVHVTVPGTYVSASISGGSCILDGETVELKGSADFSPQFRVAGVELLSVTMLDEDGEKVRDEANNVIDLLDVTSRTVVEPKVIEVRVTGAIDATKSAVTLHDNTGTVVDVGTFEADPEATGTYVARIDGYVDSDAVREFQDGLYAIQVFAEDGAGNRLTNGSDDFVIVCGAEEAQGDGTKLVKPDGNLVVDLHAPQVNVEYPHDKAYAGYSPTQAARTAEAPEKVDFFASAATVEIEITDLNVDEAATTVFGTTLADLFHDPSTAIEGIPCSVTFDTAPSGARKITITAQCGEGVYDVTGLVSAKDTVAGHQASTLDHLSFDGHALDLTHFVVDVTAPDVRDARIAVEPFDLGTDANGSAITNGADNNGNRVYVVAGEKAGNALVLVVDEPYGIRSVELLDGGPYADGLGGFTAALESGNAGLTEAGHVGTYELAVIDSLVDGADFADDVTFRITDFAGNQYLWSMGADGTSRTAPGGGGYQDFSETNADLMHDLAGDGSYVNPMGHPTLLVPDDTDPLLTVTGPEDRTDPAASGYERFFDADQDLSLALTELNVRLLLGFESGGLYDPYGYVNGTYQGLDPNRTVLTYTFTPALPSATPVDRAVTVSDLLGDPANPALFTWATTLSQEGDYANVRGAFTDVAGNASGTTTIADFTIDTTAPMVEVTFDVAAESGYSSQGRTATIAVTEHNFDPALFEVGVTMTDCASGSTAPVPTSWADDGDVHICTVEFPQDGTYTLTVAGKDKAGNACVPYDSGTFVVDTEAPAIATYHANGEAPAAEFDTDAPVTELPEPSGTYDDGSGTIQFYTHAISIDAKVQDRNFSSADTHVFVTKDGVEAEQPASWVRTPDTRGENGRELWQTSVAYLEDGEYLAPRVTSADLAGNASDNAADAQATRFVIDLKAPTVDVRVDRSPSAQGSDGEDPVNFYNQATTMTITVSDEHRLRSVELDDPDDLYSVTQSQASAEGQQQVVLTVSLKDGTNAATAEFDRPITLTAVDLAGNSRAWTIGHEGEVTVDKVASMEANPAINGGKDHPEALVQDTVAPVVALSGATAGTYYNSAQQVTATVSEFRMDYLQRFDGGRVIVTVTMRDADARGATSTWTINAQDFSGTRPDYSYVEDFSSDGHYALSAQFEDFAGNLSNLATIGEFTIDTTDPVIDVEFDNDDVRNDKYYKATRTATITVTEHNFDPSLISIQTTGEVSGWTHNGDVHTCTVFFGEGSAHTLKVSGSDLAGNQANEFEEPEFVVDLTEPTIQIAGIAQRLGLVSDDASEGLVGAYHGELEDRNAYNGVVVPTITYTDNEELSSADISFAIVGSKNGEEVEYSATTSPEGKEMTTTFRDLGYVGPGAGDGSNWDEFYVDDYDVNSDDIYTLSATMCDQAGNEAEAEVVFSVNRYGSNYVVSLLGLSADEAEQYEQTGMLSEAPTIVVYEVSVSGVADHDEDGNLVTDNHHVQKEFANVTAPIDQSSGLGEGYGLVIIDNDSQENGWSEYVYTIRSANFGEGSSSDHNDRGQGAYRVNVMSDDLSSNANSTAAYWGSDSARREVTAVGSTTEFVLDELAPAIDDLNLPQHLSAGQAFEASFHVTDDITSGDVVRVFVDGEELPASEVSGPASGVGTFTFSIPAHAFDWSRDVRIEVTDYAGRTVTAGNDAWFWQSSFIPEGLAGAGVVAACVAGVVALRRRKAAQEPELI